MVSMCGVLFKFLVMINLVLTWQPFKKTSGNPVVINSGPKNRTISGISSYSFPFRNWKGTVDEEARKKRTRFEEGRKNYQGSEEKIKPERKAIIFHHIPCSLNMLDVNHVVSKFVHSVQYD